jgi:hypothetical protein
MSLLFFATPSDKTGEAIMQAIKDQLSDESVDLCTTASSLELKLSGDRTDEKAAILVPTDEEELIDIYSMKKLFTRIPVILVLPNRDRFVEAMGYRLRPRLMSHRDVGIMEAMATLRNIVKYSSDVKN